MNRAKAYEIVPVCRTGGAPRGQSQHGNTRLRRPLARVGRRRDLPSGDPTAHGRRRGRARLFVPCVPRLLPGRGATPLSSHWTRFGQIEILHRLSDMGKRHLFDLIKEYRQLVSEVARLQAEVDRELPAALAALPTTYGYADMGSFIKAVVHACRQSRQPKAAARAPRAKGKRAKVAIGAGLAKAEQSAQLPAEPPRPTGTSLDDPKSFGLMPDLGLLGTTGGDSPHQQAKLTGALKFAQQVLHTSGVPAAVWREWRQFERKASEVLRTLNTVVRTEEV